MTPPSDPFQPVPADDFLRQAREGVDVLDVRPGPAYADSHLRGSIFIGLGRMFPNWAQVLLDPARPLQLVAEPGDERPALAALAEIGFADLRGYLDGGFAAVAGNAEHLARTERVDYAGLARELDSPMPPHLVDVRQPQEWQQGRIASAPNLPLTEFAARLGEVPREGRVILQCQGGYRSLIAASFLERDGHETTCDMEGGFGAWAEAGLPIQPAS